MMGGGWALALGLIAALAAARAVPRGLAWRRRRLARLFLERHHPAYLSTPKTRKVLFIHPTTYQEDGSLFKERVVHSPALTFPLLAALTPPHWAVELCYETSESIPWDTEADVIALSNMGHSLWRAREIARDFRNLGKHTVIGGTMASLIPDWVQEVCDTVVVGDAEQTWPQFLRDFEAGSPKPRYVEPAKHPVGDLPVPRYDLLLEKDTVGWMMPVQIARGCPYRCRFCTINALSKGLYTPRPVEHIVRDVRSVRELGCRFFFFLDDNIAGDLDFAGRLFEAVQPLAVKWCSQSTLDILKQQGLLEKAVDSGAVTLCFGLESLSQKSLTNVAKGFYRVDQYDSQIAAIGHAGLMQSAEFIIGLDHDTPETIDRLAGYIVEQAIPLVRCYIYAPIPGTPVWHDFQKQGRLLSEDFSSIGGANVGFRPVHFTPEQLLESYWSLMQRIYSWPAILRRVFGRRRRGLGNALLVLVANLQYRRLVNKRTIPGLA
ncbi:MAG: B12-binding domain-containing radical SAM protein [Candidatus Wallbacteria bacterium]|nr:B12-binding domain-containing radical SAM protein [Candidatus Wallbacteria bacterium]